MNGISTEEITTLLTNAFGKCIAEIKSNSESAGQVATGKTLRSLEFTLQKEGTAYIARILGRPYFGTLETGRGVYQGGKGDPRGFNQRLIEWMKARGFQCRSEEEYERQANRLRWYINKFGTKLYQKGGRKDIFSPAVADLTQVIEEELIVFYTHQIEDMFTRGFQGFGNSPLSQ